MSNFQPGMIGTVVNCDYLQVRKKEGNDYVPPARGEQLKVGTKVKLLSLDDKFWYRIEYKGRMGFIFKDYVEI